MGGYGSGATSMRPSTDELPRLDLRPLFRAGLLVPPAGHRASTAHRWTARGEETARATVLHDPHARPGVLALAWERAGRSGSELVPLAWTAAGFGGRRPWACCPRCGGRVAVLWLTGAGFRCRACAGAAYSSTRDDAYFRAVRACERARARFGVDPAGESWAGMVWERPAPERPPTMHRRTYRRLLAALRDAEDRCRREWYGALAAAAARWA